MYRLLVAHSRTRGLKLPGWQLSVKADVTVIANPTMYNLDRQGSF